MRLNKSLISAFLGVLIFATSFEACAATVQAKHKNKWGKYAKAEVSERYRANFQALIDELESHGYRIDFMNGLGRPGHCDPPRYKHQCGWAIDINQTARGVVTRRYPVDASALARRHGLFSGGDWVDNDYGHFESPRGSVNVVTRRPSSRRSYSQTVNAVPYY